MLVMPTHHYVFPARLVRVVDGDTLDVLIDQGMHSNRTERVRLLRVNTPEMHTRTYAAGLAAKAYVMTWTSVALGTWPFLIETHKSDVFGRYLAEVWRACDGANLSDDLLTSGHAVAYQ